MIGDLFDSPWKILIVAVVILVLFGSAKLPGAARSLGKSMRILKAEVKDLHEEETEPASAGPGIAGPQPVTAQQQLAAQQLEAQKLAAQQLEAQHTEQAQQQIDALQRQLDDLKQPVASAHAAQRAVQPAGQPTQQAG
jgi:sec-independent protein translocase protein TatA